MLGDGDGCTPLVRQPSQLDLFVPPAMKMVLPFCTKSKATHAPPFSYLLNALLMKKRISLDGMVMGIQSK
jgi:hypothetical protein